MEKPSLLIVLILFSGLVAAQQIPEFTERTTSLYNMDMTNTSFSLQEDSEEGFAVIQLNETVNQAITLETNYSTAGNSSIQVSSFLDKPNSSQEGVKDEIIETVELEGQKKLKFNETGYNAFFIRMNSDSGEKPYLNSLKAVEETGPAEDTPDTSEEPDKALPVNPAIIGGLVAVLLGLVVLLVYGQLD